LETLGEERRRIEMEKELLPNNVTLAGLRGLLREARKNVAKEEAVYVDLVMWHYDEPPTGTGALREKIGVYRSDEGPTEHFNSLGEAHEYIKGWKEEEC